MKKINIENILSNMDNYGKNLNTTEGICVGFYNKKKDDIYWFKVNKYDNTNKLVCYGSYYGSSSCLGSTIVSIYNDSEHRDYMDLNIIVKNNNIKIFEKHFNPDIIKNYIGDNGIETYYNLDKTLFMDSKIILGFTTRDLHRFPKQPVEISGCWLKLIS